MMFNIWKKKKQIIEPQSYYSDILVNQPQNSWYSHWGIKVLDYCEDPERMLEDRKNFGEKSLTFISVFGYISGLKSYFGGNGEFLDYQGIINLGPYFPLYFKGHKTSKEIEDLSFHNLLLESGKSVPINIIGCFYDGDSHYTLESLVLKMGDYISPKPKIKR